MSELDDAPAKPVGGSHRAGMIEYLVIVGLIAAMALGTLFAVSDWIGGRWDELKTAFTSPPK